MQNVKIVIMVALTLVLSLPAWAAAAPSPKAQQKPLKVFILIGTSNMMGFGGSVGLLPPDLRKPQKNVFVYNVQQNTWTHMRPFKWIQCGPEHSFAHAMVKYFHQPVGIIKIIPGMKMYKGDTTRYTDTVALGWSPEINHPAKGWSGVYKNFIKLVHRAEKKRPIVLCGICWDESGRDSMKKTWADAYEKNMRHLVNSLRRDLHAPMLPFVCALDNTHPGNPKMFPYMHAIRKAQRSLAASMPAFSVFDQNDLPRVMFQPNMPIYEKHNDHFTTAGQVESGKRYAKAMIALLKQEKKAPK